MVSDLDRYLFDLRGYLILEAALSRGEVDACNAAVDAVPDLPPGEWYGYVHSENMEPSRGRALQQAYEIGPPFEYLIDHPSWIGRVRHFLGDSDPFDRFFGDVFIDENFVSMRGPHEAIGLHSGGDRACKRTTYRVHQGRFMCMQINVLVALTDIGPGDGATMVVPASHKANFPHPECEEKRISDGAAADGTTGAIEVHLKAGDAILFSDAISHGSARRTNHGERRIAVYRYSPPFTFFRFGYRPSPELLDRLDPTRRAIVWPFEEWERTPNRLAE